MTECRAQLRRRATILFLDNSLVWVSDRTRFLDNKGRPGPTGRQADCNGLSCSSLGEIRRKLEASTEFPPSPPLSSNVQAVRNAGVFCATDRELRYPDAVCCCSPTGPTPGRGWFCNRLFRERGTPGRFIKENPGTRRRGAPIRTSFQVDEPNERHSRSEANVLNHPTPGNPSPFIQPGASLRTPTFLTKQG